MKDIIVSVVAIVAITALVLLGIGTVPQQTQTQQLSQNAAGKAFSTVEEEPEPCTNINCKCRDGLPASETVNCPKGILKRNLIKRYVPFSIPSLSGDVAQAFNGGKGSTYLLAVVYGGTSPYTAYYGTQSPYGNSHVDESTTTSITCRPAISIGSTSWSVCVNAGENPASVCSAAAKAKPECADLINKVQTAINDCVKWAKVICGVSE